MPVNLKYTIGALLTIPLLPVLYLQGRRIRSVIPDLPEAADREGACAPYDSEARQLKMLVIGESTMAGVGVATHREGFAGALAEELSHLHRANIHWTVSARSGYTARQVRDDLLAKVPITSPDLVVIGLGGNDAFHLHTPSHWRKQVTGLIADLRTKFPGAFLVFCNMPPIKEFPAFTPLLRFTIGNLVEIFGEELKTIALNYDNVFFYSRVITASDWIERLGMTASVEDFFSDGVHPSGLTYQTWAKDLAAAIHEDGRTAEKWKDL